MTFFQVRVLDGIDLTSDNRNIHCYIEVSSVYSSGEINLPWSVSTAGQLEGKVPCSVADNCDEKHAQASSLIHPSNTLYFFEYPGGPEKMGPRHIAWGYWALDERGEQTSTITSCVWDEIRNEWCLELELDGLVFQMTR
jgi:hypothetical protein